LCPQLLCPQLLLRLPVLVHAPLLLLTILNVRLMLPQMRCLKTVLLLLGLEAVEQVAQPQQTWLHWNVNGQLKLIGHAVKIVLLLLGPVARGQAALLHES
jgi:hypothetical protein